jgi:hypothetical protein
VFVGTGPSSDAPLFAKTWKLSLTICTYWFRPAAPFGSGGSESWTATPSKFLPAVGAALVGALDWTTGSAELLPFGVGSLCSSCSVRAL